MFLVTSPIVINVPTRGLLAVETMHAIVRWLANLNIKRNMTSMFVNKKHRYSNFVQFYLAKTTFDCAQAPLLWKNICYSSKARSWLKCAILNIQTSCYLAVDGKSKGTLSELFIILLMVLVAGNTKEFIFFILWLVDVTMNL